MTVIFCLMIVPIFGVEIHEEILFEVTGEEKYCNNTVLKTSDGLCLAENLTIFDSDNEQTDINELPLVDGDYKMFEIYRKIKTETSIDISNLNFHHDEKILSWIANNKNNNEVDKLMDSGPIFKIDHVVLDNTIKIIENASKFIDAYDVGNREKGRPKIGKSALKRSEPRKKAKNKDDIVKRSARLAKE
ncbi:hypothetical protein BpHYR1_020623 [Brachionus plicatilis]|uniref:Uncharacterized protein n=1 Tax=Brachionus plicatilis TaxID=10195 RepID=A0A3M7RSG4_BRAPC|nr:hypothetical protein BpHYR1_020623 [Brachionus plicatilis]